MRKIFIVMSVFVVVMVSSPSVLLAGIYEDKHYLENTLREWETLAKKGNAEAQFQLGKMYYKVRRSLYRPDYTEKAVMWVWRAVKQGHAGAEKLFQKIETDAEMDRDVALRMAIDLETSREERAASIRELQKLPDKVSEIGAKDREAKKQKKKNELAARKRIENFAAKHPGQTDLIELYAQDQADGGSVLGYLKNMGERAIDDKQRDVRAKKELEPLKPEHTQQSRKKPSPPTPSVIAKSATKPTPPSSKTFMFICNDLKATYYDKVNKEGPFTGFVSASVFIDTGSNTAELVLGSRSVAKISTRSNSNMSLLVEKENSQILFTGTTPDEAIYFTLYTKEMKLVASYGDLVLKINGCQNIKK